MLKNTKLSVYYFIGLLLLSFSPFFIIQRFNLLPISVFNGFEYQGFSDFLQVWHKSNLGTFTLLFTPHLLFTFILFKIFPAYIANTLLFGGIKFLAGTSIYFLLNYFTRNKIIRILGSLFYLLSIYGQAITENTLPGGYLFYAVLPLIFYLFITISPKNRAKNIFLYVLLSLLIIDTNFTYIFYLFLLLFLYAIYKYIFRKNSLQIKYFFIFLVLFILISQVYYLPLFAHNNLYKNDIIEQSLAAESAAWKSYHSSITEVLRLMGSLDFYDDSGGVYSRPFFLYFIKNPIILFVSFVFLIISMAGFLWDRKNSISDEEKSKPFYIFLLLVFVFLSIGAHSTNPLKGFYQIISERFLFFAIFRDPYKSVSLINLIFTIGIVFTLNRIINKRRFFVTTAIVYCTLLGILSYSYLKGDVYKKSEMIRVPSYVYEFADWNRNNKEIFNNKKLLMPSQPFPILNFALYKNKGSPIFFQILNSTAVQNSANFTPYIEKMQKSINSNETEFERIVGFYNIPYVLNLKDINHRVYRSENPQKTSEILNEKMYKIKQFGTNNEIELFKVDNGWFNNVVYIPEKINYTGQAVKKENLVEIFKAEKNNSFAFLDDEAHASFTNDLNQIPDMKVIKKSNTDYELKLNNIKKNFVLVFNESYSKGWVLKGIDNLFKEIRVRHFVVNGFTNGFYIEKDSIKNNVDPKYYTTNSDGSINVSLRLYFQPQLYFYLGVIISSITFFATLFCVLYARLKTKSLT